MVLKTVKYNYDFNDKKPKEDRYFQANPKKKGCKSFTEIFQKMKN